jgi:hypothetical protein
MTSRTASSVFRAALLGRESDAEKLTAATLRREVAQLPPVRKGSISALQRYWVKTTKNPNGVGYLDAIQAWMQ